MSCILIVFHVALIFTGNNPDHSLLDMVCGALPSITTDLKLLGPDGKEPSLSWTSPEAPCRLPPTPPAAS
jgi:hypothetical protein